MSTNKKRIIPETKVCRTCKLELPAAKFGRNNRNRDGLHSYCKSCYSAYIQSKSKPENLKKAMKKYNAKPEVKEKRKEYQEKYNTKPEVKQRHNELQRKRRLEKKQNQSKVVKKDISIFDKIKNWFKK